MCLEVVGASTLNSDSPSACLQALSLLQALAMFPVEQPSS